MNIYQNYIYIKTHNLCSHNNDKSKYSLMLLICRYCTCHLRKKFMKFFKHLKQASSQRFSTPFKGLSNSSVLNSAHATQSIPKSGSIFFMVSPDPELQGFSPGHWPRLPSPYILLVNSPLPSFYSASLQLLGVRLPPLLINYSTTKLLRLCWC